MKTTKTIIAVMLLCSVLSNVAFAFDPIYINFQPAASSVPPGYLVDGGDNYGDRGNGYSYGWDGDNFEVRDRNAHADQRYDTLNHLQKSGPDATWEIGIPNGTYDVDVVFGDPEFTDQTNDMNVEGVLLDDPDGQDNFDEHFGVVVVVSDGRLTVSPQGSASNSKICYIDIYVAESDPPTPDPATFASAPAAISDTAISMTATTGTDASGPVEYFFDETTSGPGATDSGWQTSPNYTDSGLLPDTQYTYTVTMRDRLGNNGTASSPASATTDADIYPPTPDPATFAMAPTADSGSAISMTATAGSDASGPVEYYFDATDGGNDSGWQTSVSYTDTGLADDTQYCYTVQMRDSLANTGTASAPSCVTTLGPPVTVPDVTGQAQATAESNIVAAGLVVGTITTSSSGSVPVGDVISQNPIGGASIPSGSPVDLVISTGAIPSPDYMAYVVAYADAMVADGRDTYGPEHTPLFASALNRSTMQIGDFGSIEGERESDRSLRGSNPQEDLGLYAILYRLTELTGQKQYAEAADQSLEYFFNNCQSANTGLMTWGEHIFWHLENEAMGGNDVHEMSSEWPHWDECYRLAPDASWNFALGLWDHQIANQSTGTFSRHTKWSSHGPSTGYEFARYAGQMISCWADAYIRPENAGRARRSDLLTAITVLVTRMEDNTNTPTGYLMAGMASDHNYFSWPSHALQLSRCLRSSAPHIENVDGVLAGRMTDLANYLDIVYVERVGHTINVAGGAYAATLDVATGEPIYRQMNEPYSSLWVTEYGAGTHAKMANRSLPCYEQVTEDHPAMSKRYEQLILSAADQYLDTTPDTGVVLKPTTFKQIINLMLNSYKITGDTVYLERANYFGELSITLFLDDGLPLPKVTNQQDWYECITGGTDYMNSLLKLQEALDAQ